MKISPSLAFTGLAQATHRFSSNGVDYEVVMTQNGVEVPVTMGPSLGMNSTGPTAAVASRKRTTIQSTSSWCGMSDVDAPSGTWKSVWGGWIVPEISLRSGQTDADEPSITQWVWVGIDGDGCDTELIQGGTVSQGNAKLRRPSPRTSRQ